jgi:hypothetical protein
MYFFNLSSEDDGERHLKFQPRDLKKGATLSQS